MKETTNDIVHEVSLRQSAVEHNVEASPVGFPSTGLSHDLSHQEEVVSGLARPRIAIHPRLRKDKIRFQSLRNAAKEIQEDEWDSIIDSLDVVIDHYDLFYNIYIEKKNQKKPVYREKTEKFISHYFDDKHARKFKDAQEKLLLSCINFVKTAPGTGLWIKFFKDLTCNFYSVQFEQEVTTTAESRFKKSWRHMLSGPYKSLLNRIMKDKELYLFFCETALRLKMGMPKASEELVAAAVEKTFKALTTDPIVPKEKISFVKVHRKNQKMVYRPEKKIKVAVDLGTEKFVPVSRQTIELQLRRTVREIFEGEAFTPTEMSRPFFPSTSANYHYTNNKVGAVGFIKKELIKMEKELQVDFIPELVEVRGELSRKFGKRGIDEQSSFVPENSELNCKCSSSTLLGRTHWVNGVAVNLDRLEKTWRELYWNIYSKALKEEPLVEPVGLAEFLKVRVITKGPPYTYTALKPLQTFLWSTLKKYQCFKLIGEVVNEEYMSKVLGTLGEGEEFCSGDYQASTDNLHSWVSETLADELFDVLSEIFPISDTLKKLVRKALTEHVFVRTEGEGKNKKVVEELPQKEGQLMGSIISFPFLCLANAAMCRYSLELDSGKTYNLRGKRNLAPLMVNGDDCASRGSHKYRDIWRKVTAIGGLLESQGKTYFSDKFVVINSARFNYMNGEYKTQPYINFGLINGCKKGAVGDETKAEKLANIGVRHQELLKWCPDYARSVLHRFFLRRWGKFLKTYANGLPWFLPNWLGGLGMLDVDNELSEIDRINASIILHEYKDLKPKNLTKASEWQMHDRVQSRIDELGIDLPDCAHAVIMSDCPNDPRSLIEENQRLYTGLVIETLFCCKNLRKDSRTVVDPDDGEKLDYKLLAAIKRNFIVHAKANDIRLRKKKGKSNYSNYRPLENDELEQEQHKELYACYIY